MAKSTDNNRLFVAMTELTNDKTGKQFEVGDVVSQKDFPEEVLANWLEIGVVMEVPEKQEVGQ